ncbi:helix-turn-helix transcriptional regulator [Lentzea sp. NBRC 102530]|uniref:helix-turn-helix transcriptional regulator n=1 Tax=Lentzea sp. NBRC 102530 TaxID=3032201 RepID=UPI0024A46C5E|nr:helix-turn-helix transcriptional regulator [Lentzea sp. NBRC 102530]GLY52882.1 DNA-binding protein [Lentzea sp. NBRC 102530]
MQELAGFLRSRRERLAPVRGGRRRTPGRRREEVAEAAGMSVDYYSRLEQARGPHPSVPVLNGLARALELDADERAHLFRLAGEAVPEEPATTSIRPGVRLLLDRLRDDLAVVISDLGDVLAATPRAEVVFGDVVGRNLLRSFFLGDQSWVPEEDREAIARAHVADLRATLARRPAARPLVDELMASPTFARLWAGHDVAVRRSARKRLRHPVAGLLEFDCEVLGAPEHDQRLVIHVAPEGSVTAARLALLVSAGEAAGRMPEPWTLVPVSPSSE